MKRTELLRKTNDKEGKKGKGKGEKKKRKKGRGGIILFI